MKQLALGNCAHRTYACAAAAFDTLIRIDDIDAVASRNAANGAFALTSTATNASRSDYICHYKTPPFFLHLLFYHEMKKMQSHFSFLYIYFSSCRFQNQEKSIITNKNTEKAERTKG